MTHEEIEQGDIAEEYVRGRLSPQDRAAFEDHYFACDDCFDKVQAIDRLASGVRNAVREGALPLSGHGRTGWYEPAFYLSAAASLVLSAALGWSLLRERPRLESELSLERQASVEGRRKLAALEQQLSARAAPKPLAALPNLPLFMLESTRAQQAQPFRVPEPSPQIALWMEPPAAPAASVYRLEIRNAADQLVETVEGSKTNSYGALAIAIPSERLKPGKYAARLYRVQASGPSLVADYRFEIVR